MSEPVVPRMQRLRARQTASHHVGCRARASKQCDCSLTAAALMKARKRDSQLHHTYSKYSLLTAVVSDMIRADEDTEDHKVTARVSINRIGSRDVERAKMLLIHRCEADGITASVMVL